MGIAHIPSMAEDSCPRPSNEAGCAKGDLARTGQIKPRHQQTATTKNNEHTSTARKGMQMYDPAVIHLHAAPINLGKSPN